MNDTKRGEGRLPGFPVKTPSFFIKLLDKTGIPNGIPSLRAGLLLLGGVGLFGLYSFQGSVEASDDVALMPLVAELAPTLHLPVSVDERVNRWMERYLNDQRPAFERYLKREGLYSGMIKEALRARGMPEDLMYLAAIESGFSPSATSRVSASGMWQFMGPTAQQFGLRIDEWVDERRDPVRATDAALDYLQALHNRFGSWYLAAAAYNAGPGRVSRALRSHAGDQAGDEELYWEIIDHLPRETRVYVPKILALSVLGAAAEDYGFDVEPMGPVEFDRVWVPSGTTLRWIARSLDTKLKTIRDLNPHLIRGVTPPDGLYPVRVPPGTSTMLVAAQRPRWRTVAVDD